MRLAVDAVSATNRSILVVTLNDHHPSLTSARAASLSTRSICTVTYLRRGSSNSTPLFSRFCSASLYGLTAAARVRAAMSNSDLLQIWSYDSLWHLHALSAGFFHVLTSRHSLPHTGHRSLMASPARRREGRRWPQVVFP